MLEPGFLPVHIPFKARRIGHANLPGNEIDDSGWNIQGIIQESTKMMNSHKLESEPEPVVITPALRHQLLVKVIEKEKPLQHRQFRSLKRIPPVRCLFGSR